MGFAEEYFLRYAFPCAGVLLDSGKISQKEYNELGDSLKTEKFPSREVIEGYFVAAFRRIRNLALEMGIRDPWDMRVLRKYWEVSHNDNVDEREGGYAKMPEAFCDFCKVHEAEVLEILDNGFLLVGYGDVKRPVNGEYVVGVRVGEKVRIHHAYAVEKVE